MGRSCFFFVKQLQSFAGVCPPISKSLNNTGNNYEEDQHAFDDDNNIGIKHPGPVAIRQHQGKNNNNRWQTCRNGDRGIKEYKEECIVGR